MPGDPPSPEMQKEQPSIESESVEKTTDVEMTIPDTEATVSGPCVTSAPAQNESPQLQDTLSAVAGLTKVVGDIFLENWQR